MTIRLYFDEDSMRHALVEALRKRNVDTLTAFEAGTTEQTDEQQLEYAAARGRAIYTVAALKCPVRVRFRTVIVECGQTRQHGSAIFVQCGRFLSDPLRMARPTQITRRHHSGPPEAILCG